MVTKMARLACFRFDASPSLGAGHAFRCLTLASALYKNGWNIHLFVNAEAHSILDLGTYACTVLDEQDCRTPEYETTNIKATHTQTDLFILDHYGKDDTYETQFRSWANRILIIDDLANRLHDCDYLLDQTYGRTPTDYKPLVPDHCKILTGSRYALLREEFASNRAVRFNAKRSESLEKIIVNFGGTDPLNHTLMALKGIVASQIPVDVRVIMGKSAPYLEAIRTYVQSQPQDRWELLINVSDMAQQMVWADLAIGAAGSSSWERCCLGLPALMTILANNQRVIAENLAKAGAVRILETVDELSFAKNLRHLHIDPSALTRMSNHARNVCDGLGAQRIVEIVSK